jgi:hypothetical protein
MPHDKKAFPYLVLGDGMMASEAARARFRLFHKIRVPIPQFHYARTKAKAQEIADKIAPWNETVIIAKIEKVVK